MDEWYDQDKQPLPTWGGHSHMNRVIQTPLGAWATPTSAPGQEASTQMTRQTHKRRTIPYLISLDAHPWQG